MTDDMNRDDAFAEHIAQPLRDEERADATFEARVMSAVQAAERADLAASTVTRSRPWLFRPYPLELTPLTSFAMAAGFAALVFAGAYALASGRAVDRNAVAAGQTVAHRGVDTVHLVRFVLVNPSARSVMLVGTFNNWQKNVTRLQASSVNGVWTVTVPLSAGRHEYAFIVSDGGSERWVADPLSDVVLDDYGTESSVISVGHAASS
jgi:hypothetical protein